MMIEIFIYSELSKDKNKNSTDQETKIHQNHNIIMQVFQHMGFETKMFSQEFQAVILFQSSQHDSYSILYLISVGYTNYLNSVYKSLMN